jgi:hypothetical protein
MSGAVGEQQRSIPEQDPVAQYANNMEAMMHDAAAIGEVIVSPRPKQTPSDIHCSWRYSFFQTEPEQTPL